MSEQRDIVEHALELARRVDEGTALTCGACTAPLPNPDCGHKANGVSPCCYPAGPDQEEIGTSLREAASEIAALRERVAMLTGAIVSLNGHLDDYWNGDKSDMTVKAICAAQQECHAALSSQPAPQADGWRDIETAPKDGTKILVANDRGMFVAEWLTLKRHENAFFDGWYIDEGKRNVMPLRGETPTRWQPLPSQPTDIGDK